MRLVYNTALIQFFMSVI